MRRTFPILLALTILVPLAHASPGSVRCGKLLDIHSGRVLSDQLIVFDADGVISAVGPQVPRLRPGGLPSIFPPPRVSLD